MTIKNHAKSEKELTCQFKVDMRNLTNFDPRTLKSQKFELRKYRRVMFDGTK